MLRCADFPFFRPFIFQNLPPFINKSRRLGDLSPSSLPPQKKCAMIAQYLLHLYNGNIGSNGIQPCCFGVVYTIHHAGGNTLPGIQPCYFWVVYTRHRYSVPQSAGCHLSHNKPANRVFLLPRRPCISTGVNSGYTIRTQFFQSTSRIWTSLMRRRASSAYSSLSSIPMNSRPYR